MYELFILGQLSWSPRHGYLIAKVIGDMMGPFRRVQWGALYPVLARLEGEGLICTQGEVDIEGRGRKVYAITDAGRMRLRDLLMNTERHLGDYDHLFLHKVMLFSGLAPEDRLYLTRHYAIYAQQNMEHLERERRDLEEHGLQYHLTPQNQENILTVLDHRINYWKNERAWAHSLIAGHNTEESA
jgi:DNA-binding PadR family transcriptional regulator